MPFFRTPNFDFLRWRWHALALSAVVLIGGLGLLVARGGLPMGIDFSGGTVLIYKFDRPITEDAVRSAIAPLPGEKIVQLYGRPGDNEILIRLPELVTEEGASLEEGSRAVDATIAEADLGTPELLSREIVGPVIGRDLQRKGLYATLASLLGIMVYIALRFRFSFAVGAIVAAFHDILVTVAFLSFFGYELSLNVVAALLTITGYSVNDTIVVFDRVRENLRSMRRDALHDVVNRSVNQTLARTIITSGTTFMAVLALYLFGGEVLHAFAFTMLVGIISGTYSTVFIASAAAIILSQRRGAARARAAGTGTADAARRKDRNARAS
jgi:preprotein translocase subunit SecF